MSIDIGKRGIGISIAVAIIVPLVLGLMFFPPAHMEIKNLPFGILSLDEGVNGTSLGDELMENIESGKLAELQGEASDDGEDNGSTDISEILSFKTYHSQEELDQAFESNELYGAMVISKDFTKMQLAAITAAQAATPSSSTLNPSLPDNAAAMAAAAQAQSTNPDASALDTAGMAAPTQEEGADSGTHPNDSEPALTVVLDYAKSPLVATQLRSTIGTLLSSSGLDAKVELINQGPANDAGAMNIFSGLFSQVMIIMPILIVAMIGGAFSVLGFGVRTAKKISQRVVRFGLCIIVDAVASVILALMGFWLLTCIANLPVEFGSFFGYVSLATLFLMIFFSGCACVRGRVAIAMGVIMIFLGMTTGYLPYEALPVFWQDWVCPWVPQYYLGNGLREVIFAGQSLWNQGTIACGIYGIVGLLLACLGVGLAGKKSQR